MDFETGKDLMDGAAQVNDHLGTLTTLVEEIGDPDLKVKIKRELGMVMAKVYTRIMAPVIREHPALDPDSPDAIEASPDKN